VAEVPVGVYVCYHYLLEVIKKLLTILEAWSDAAEEPIGSGGG